MRPDRLIFWPASTKGPAPMGLSLDQINQEVEKKYAPFVVTDVPGGEVTLRSPLRLAKNERAQLLQLHGTMKSAQEDNDLEALIGIACDTIELVATGAEGKRLLKAIGDDLPKLMFVLEAYMEEQQPGEALRSDG